MWRRFLWSSRQEACRWLRLFSRRQEEGGLASGLNQRQINYNGPVFGVVLPATVFCYREPKVHISHFLFRQLATSKKTTMQGAVNVTMEQNGGGAIEAGKRAAAWAAVDELIEVSCRSRIAIGYVWSVQFQNCLVAYEVRGVTALSEASNYSNSSVFDSNIFKVGQIVCM